MRLVQVDQQVPVTLGLGQHALQLLDERLPPCRVGPAEQLLGLLPAQAQAVQGGTDRLTATDPAKLLAYPADQALERPAGCCVGVGYGQAGGMPSGADGLAKASLDAGAKGGRPPMRR